MRNVYRKEAEDNLAFAEIIMKRRYDERHVPNRFKVGDKEFLRLYKGYSIKGQSLKLGMQRIGPYPIIEKVGRLAYKL